MLGLKKQQDGAQNEAEEFPRFDGICLFFAIDALHKRLLLKNNWSEQLFQANLARLGKDNDYEKRGLDSYPPSRKDSRP